MELTSRAGKSFSGEVHPAVKQYGRSVIKGEGKRGLEVVFCK